MEEPEPLWEDLSRCEYSVFSSGSPTYEDDCGEPATHRLSHDDGKTWLYLCAVHARQIEEAADDGG